MPPSFKSPWRLKIEAQISEGRGQMCMYSLRDFLGRFQELQESCRTATLGASPTTANRIVGKSAPGEAEFQVTQLLSQLKAEKAQYDEDRKNFFSGLFEAEERSQRLEEDLKMYSSEVRRLRRLGGSNSPVRVAEKASVTSNVSAFSQPLSASESSSAKEILLTSTVSEKASLEEEDITSASVLPQKVKRQKRIHGAHLLCMASVTVTPTYSGEDDDELAVMAVGTANGCIKIMDMSAGTILAEHAFSQADSMMAPEVTHVALSEDLSALLCCTSDRCTLRVLDLKLETNEDSTFSVEIISRGRVPNCNASSITGCGFAQHPGFSKNNFLDSGKGTLRLNGPSSRGFTVSRDRTIKFYDLHAFSLLKTVPVPSSITAACVFQGVLCTGHESGQLTLWSAITGEFVQQLSEGNAPPTLTEESPISTQPPQMSASCVGFDRSRLAFSPSGRAGDLASSMEQRSPSKFLSGRVETVLGVNFGAQCTLLACQTAGEGLKLFRRNSLADSERKGVDWVLLHTLQIKAAVRDNRQPSNATSIATAAPVFSSDAKLVSAVLGTGLYTFTVEDGILLAQVPQLLEPPLAMSWTLPTLVSGHAFGTLRLWA